jgi:hypothetical protein
VRDIVQPVDIFIIRVHKGRTEKHMKNNDHNIYLFSYYLFIYLSIGAGD